MVDFNLFNINSMALGIIATCILIFIVYRKIEFNKYVPGLICLEEMMDETGANGYFLKPFNFSEFDLLDEFISKA